MQALLSQWTENAPSKEVGSVCCLAREDICPDPWLDSTRTSDNTCRQRNGLNLSPSDLRARRPHVLKPAFPLLCTRQLKLLSSLLEDLCLTRPLICTHR